MKPESMLDSLMEWVPQEITTVKSPNAHRVNSLVEQEWIDVKEALKDEEGSDENDMEL